MNNIPILLYHSISNTGNLYSVKKNEFVKQMEFLQKNDYKSISLNTFVRKNKLPENLPTKSVIITFDDGYEDNFTTAMPILKKYDFTATFFVTTNFINNKKGMLSSNQISQLANNGMYIGSHSHNHIFLNNVNQKQLFVELTQSKIILEDITKQPVNHLSLPGGRYNKNVLEAAYNANYKTICNSNIKLININSNKYELGRIPIKKKMVLANFIKIIRNDNKFMNKLRFTFLYKKYFRNILGNRAYDRLWHLKND